MSSLSWIYPADALIALRRQQVAAEAAAPVTAGIEVDQLHFDYEISGDRPGWRPLRAFDDGRQTFIEFPPTLAVGEAPPLFLIGAKGVAELVNYRLRGRYYVVDRLFDVAELRLGTKHQEVVRITRSAAAVGHRQRTALIVWQRIVFPDGSSIRLDNAPATDPSGYAGLADKVDFHTWALLKGVVLSTMLGVGAELQFGGESDLVQALRQSSQQSVSRAGDQLTARNLQIQPTITIRPGAPVRLLVHRDLVLKAWKED